MCQFFLPIGVVAGLVVSAVSWALVLVIGLRHLRAGAPAVLTVLAALTGGGSVVVYVIDQVQVHRSTTCPPASVLDSNVVVELAGAAYGVGVLLLAAAVGLALRRVRRAPSQGLGADVHRRRLS